MGAGRINAELAADDRLYHQPGSPADMAAQAGRNRDRPLLKLKLGRQQSLAIVEAVRRAAPDARLIVDVNGAWDIDELKRLADPLARLGVELIEQPLPASDDAGLPPTEVPSRCVPMNPVWTRVRCRHSTRDTPASTSNWTRPAA